jgi:Rap1a immunity proteins
MTKASNRKNRLQPTGAPHPLGAAGLAAGALLATVLIASPAAAVSPAPPPPESFATSQTGETLWTACGGSPAGRVPQTCSAYIVGASDGVALAAASARPFCLDARVQADELAEVVRRYMAAHPQSRSNSAAAVVAAALRETYPCRPGAWR